MNEQSNKSQGGVESELKAAREAYEKKQDEAKERFWLTNVSVSLLFGLLSIILDAAVVIEFPTTAPELPAIPWPWWVIGGVVAYAMASYLVSRLHPASKLLRGLLRIPTWIELQNFGDQRFARISYIALFSIPMLVFFLQQNPFEAKWVTELGIPPNLKISFFVALSFSIALITFTLGCPKELRRKLPFEGARNVNLVLSEVISPAISLNEGRDYYDPILDQEVLEMRTVCWAFYTFGLVLSLILLYRSAVLVLYA